MNGREKQRRTDIKTSKREIANTESKTEVLRIAQDILLPPREPSQSLNRLSETLANRSPHPNEMRNQQSYPPTDPTNLPRRRKHARVRVLAAISASKLSAKR